MIKYCPNCAQLLSDKNDIKGKKLAQGIKVCNDCDAKFLIIQTTKEKDETNTDK